jgi:hypothetical protein
MLQDIANAHTFFGPSLPCVRGKSVKSKPQRVESVYITIPAEILEQHKYVTIVADMMFVSRVPFFVTLSRDIRFTIMKFE